MISIVTPTYNEKENIAFFIKEITTCITALKRKFEIIVVDDNSPDGTSEVVLSLKRKYPNVSLIKRINKRGIGSAYLDGYRAAKGDILIGIDADLSPSLATIPLLLSDIHRGNDMVIGSRYMLNSHVYEQSAFRQIGSKLFNKYIQFSLHIPISDITHSCRAIKKEVFQDISKKTIESGHPSFFIELTFWAKKKGYKISEVPTTFTERKHGISKLNTFQGLKNAIKTVKRLKNEYE